MRSSISCLNIEGGFFSIDLLKYILSKKQGYIEMKVLENNKKAYKLYELLCGRYLKSFDTHIVEEDNDLFKYYTFNTMDIIY